MAFAWQKISKYDAKLLFCGNRNMHANLEYVKQ